MASSQSVKYFGLTWTDCFAIVYSMFILILLLSISQPGLHVTDEIVYLLSVDSVNRYQSFEILNGLSGIDSSSLVFLEMFTRHEGRLYGQYPPLHPLMMQIPYAVNGLSGLIFINTIAFALTLLVLKKISDRLFNDSALSLAVVVSYSLFTYATKYSIEAWPHSITVLFTTLGVWLALKSRENDSHLLFAAGLSLGLAFGLRYQAILVALVTLVYLIGRHGVRNTLGFFAGVGLPVAATLLLNYSIYGSILFSGYEGTRSDFGGPAHFILFAIFFALYILAAFSRKSFDGRLVKITGLAVILLLACSLVINLPVFSHVKTSAQILYAEVFDIQSFPGVFVSPRKKSLLQATPYLLLGLAFPLVFWKKLSNPGILFITSLALSGPLFFTSRVGQHGGETPAMRYFLESLPFLLILSVYVIKRQVDETGFLRKVPKVLAATACITILVAFTASMANFTGPDGVLDPVVYHTIHYIIIGLLIASFILVTKKRSSILAIIFLLAVTLSFSYAFFTNTYDTVNSIQSRETQAQSLAKICNQVPDNSLIFYNKTESALTVGALKTCRNVMVASLVDDLQAGRLAAYKLGQGGRVYIHAGLSQDPIIVDELPASLKEYDLTLVESRPYTLYEVRKK